MMSLGVLIIDYETIFNEVHPDCVVFFFFGGGGGI